MSDKKKTEVPSRVAQHYAIIPLLTAASVDRVVSVLVKRGYAVGPLASSQKAYTSAEGNLCTILAIDLKKSIPDDGSDSRVVFYEDIKDVLKVTDTRYYMLTVGELYGAFTWMIGNVTAEEAEKAASTGASFNKTRGDLN